MSIRLYGWPNSTAARVHWALEELGVGYEYVTLDRKAGENRTPAYLAINPTGKVPGLVDDGQAYFESAAIILYLGAGVLTAWAAGPYVHRVSVAAYEDVEAELHRVATLRYGLTRAGLGLFLVATILVSFVALSA